MAVCGFDASLKVSRLVGVVSLRVTLVFVVVEAEMTLTVFIALMFLSVMFKVSNSRRVINGFSLFFPRLQYLPRPAGGALGWLCCSLLHI